MVIFHGELLNNQMLWFMTLITDSWDITSVNPQINPGWFIKGFTGPPNGEESATSISPIRPAQVTSPW